MIEGAIFDLDGTLLDSMYVWEHIGETYLESKGITPPDDIYWIVKPMSLAQCCRYFRDRFGLTETTEQLEQEINTLVEKQYIEHAPLKPHVEAFLYRLRDAGVRMCVATATAHYQAEAALRRCGVLEVFDFILTAGEVGAGKDKPLIFEQACARLGTRKESTVIFEDALHAIETAKKAGFRVAAVQEDASALQVNQIKVLADYYYNTLEECEVAGL